MGCAHLGECALGKDAIKQEGQQEWPNDESGIVETHINKQVFPQAPSPTMTSLRRISAITAAAEFVREGDPRIIDLEGWLDDGCSDNRERTEWVVGARMVQEEM